MWSLPQIICIFKAQGKLPLLYPLSVLLPPHQINPPPTRQLCHIGRAENTVFKPAHFLPTSLDSSQTGTSFPLLLRNISK